MEGMSAGLAMAKGWQTGLVVVIYILVLLGIGVYVSRGMKSAKDFFIGGAAIGPTFVAFSAAASFMSGWGFVGGPGQLYLNGYSPMLVLELFALIGMGLSYFLVAVPIRKMVQQYKILTIPDAIRARFSNEKAAKVVALGIFIGVFPYMLAQYLAMGYIGQTVFGFEFWQGCIIGVIIMIAYSTLGGIKASIYSEFLQACLMCVGAVAMLIVGIRLCGGWTNCFSTLSGIPEYMDIFKSSFKGGGSVWGMISWALMFGLGVSAAPHVISRFYAIKKVSALKTALVVSLVVYMVFSWAEWSGFFMRYLTETGAVPKLAKPDLAGPTYVMYAFGSVGAGLMVGAVLSGIMSTVNSFMVTATSTVIRDFLTPYLKKHGRVLTAKQELYISRYGMIAVALVPLPFVFHPPELLMWIAAAAWGIWVATIFPPLVFTLRWKRTTSNGVFWGALMGLSSSVLLSLLKEFAGIHTVIEPGAWGMLIGCASLIIVSLVGVKEKEVHQIIDTVSESAA
jgi:sodium/proline symporter